MKTGKRVLFGCVGIGMLGSLVHDIIVGQFSMHGEAFQRTAHPWGFWLYGAFIATLGLAGLYAAAFGFDQDQMH